MILSGPIKKPLSGAKAKSAVIFLHGYGSDGENLIGLAPFMQEAFPDTVFLSPNAPTKMPYYGGGYEWFPLTDRNYAAMLQGAKMVAPIINQFIDEVLAEYELKDENIALIGFSQGTMVSLFSAIRRLQKIAGIVGFSGALVAPELVATDAKVKPDICLIHGEADDVVPFAAMAQAEKALKNAGFKVESHARPNLPHSIDPEGIDIAIKFLKSKLS